MRFLLASLAGALLWAQTPAPKPAAPVKTAPLVKPAAVKPAPPAAPAAVKPAITPAPAASPVAPTAVVFTVGDEKMTRAQFESFVAMLPENVQKEVATGNGRKVAEQLADLKAMAQEAKRRGLDQKPDVKLQLAIQHESVLAQSVVQDLGKSLPVPEASTQKYYTEHQSEYESASARHILVRFTGSRLPVRPGQKELTEPEALAKAQELKKRIAGGEDFAAVAKTDSDDVGTAAQGGSLGSFTRGRMVPEFENAVFSQTVNQVSEPIKTQFGYHLIQVQERGAKPLAEVRASIEQQLRGQLLKAAVDEIKAKAVIVLDDTYFGKATPMIEPVH